MRLTFLHGFMGHPSDWDQIRDGFFDHETSAVSLPEAEDWATSIHALARTLPQKSILVGYSMGARMALGLALEYPGRCEGLVFLSGNPGLESDDERERRRNVDLKIAHRLETDSLDQFLTDWYSLPVFATVSESVRQAEQQRKRQMQRDGQSTRQQWARMLRANSVSTQPNYWPRLEELSVPVLLVAGERDEKYRKIIERFAECLAIVSPTVRIVPHCGHIVHREDPDALTKNLREFLDTISHP
ncbi:MAG: alpha/beta fold hydrolase [Planctomycetota bacterium]